MVATSTIEPRLPSIGMAFIRTPLAPSFSWSSGGGWSTIWPPGHLRLVEPMPASQCSAHAVPPSDTRMVAMMIGGPHTSD